jgi:hypothetical protein
MYRSLALVLIVVASFASPAAAADRPKLTPLAADVDWSAVPQAVRPSRGALLPSLYVSLAGLNAFDAYSTMKGIGRGASEANPLMSGVAGNAAALWAVKGGVTAGSIVLAERLWRQNRKAAAIAVMVASNGVMATVAARNASVLRQTR